MHQPSTKKSFLIFLSVFIFVAGATYLISLIARGYQFSLVSGPNLKATGLLSATSTPKSASVYINNRLITATDDTVNLSPDTYTVKIVKDGYLPWQKEIVIKKEVVFQTDAKLFRSVPDLRPITLSGAINPIISPDNSKIIYAVASASASQDNGLYQLDLTDRPLPLNKNLPRQLYPNYANINWSQFQFQFSPDSRSILATNPQKNISYLVNLDNLAGSRQFYDITSQIDIIQKEWQHQIFENLNQRFTQLPLEIQQAISTPSASNLAFSSNDTKVLYLTNQDSTLKNSYMSPPPAQSTQPQDRHLKTDNYYVYDLKDDTNFLIGSQPDIQNPFWLPNSSNIIYTQDQQIKVIEYDATNNLTLFAKNFSPQVVFPWPSGNRIITLTAAYPGAPQNLYTISLQ